MTMRLLLSGATGPGHLPSHPPTCLLDLPSVLDTTSQFLLPGCDLGQKCHLWGSLLCTPIALSPLSYCCHILSSLLQPHSSLSIHRHSSMSSMISSSYATPTAVPEKNCPSIDFSLINEPMTHGCLVSFLLWSFPGSPASPQWPMLPYVPIARFLYLPQACSVMLRGLSHLLPNESYLCSQLAAWPPGRGGAQVLS